MSRDTSGIARVVLCCGATLLTLTGCGKHDQRSASAGGNENAPHTVAWYEAHPDVLRKDDKLCAGQNPSLGRAACQSVYSAESSLAAVEMQNAAAKNGAADKPHNHP